MITNETSDPGTPSLSDLLEAIGETHSFRVLQMIDEKGRIEVDTIEFHSTADADTLRTEQLPYLEEAGFIDADQSGEVVSKGPRFGELQPYLENWSFLHS